jgi:methyl-accepting chemotaxis protein
MDFQMRKNYFIEKRFQIKYMLLTILLLFVYSFIFIVIIFAPYMLTLYFNYPLVEKAEAARAILILHAKVWPGIATIIILFGAISIFITHKIAGPLYRLKKTLSQVTDGDLNIVVKLRKWDDLKDLAEHVNILIGELRTFVTALRNDYNLLSEYMLELEHKIEVKMLTEEEGKEIINKVQESRKNIENALKKFKIKQ